MRLSNLKLVIFDLDGTLVDAYPAIIKSFNYTMQRLNYPYQSALIIRRAVGWGDENLLKPFLKRKDLKSALLIYRQHHKNSLIKLSRLFPKVKRILTYLKSKGYKITVASNRPTKFSWILIRHLGLERYFDYVLCADRLKYIKPHPEILNRIIKNFKVKPQEAIYIGDMAIDAEAGRRAKIKTIIVTTGSSTKGEIQKVKPYCIIKHLEELFKGRLCPPIF